MKYLHYRSAPFSLDRSMVYAQRDNRDRNSAGYFEKPKGLWITDESEESWRGWCLSEGFRLQDLTYCYEVGLDESRILFLRTEAEVMDFTREYGKPWLPEVSTRLAIDWPRLTREYAGIAIMPYQHGCRFGMDTSWYYGWDCSSGCIWDLSAVTSFEFLYETTEGELTRQMEAKREEWALNT